MGYFISKILVEVMKIHNNIVSNSSKKGCTMLLFISAIWQKNSYSFQYLIHLKVTNRDNFCFEKKKKNESASGYGTLESSSYQLTS